MGEVRWWKGDRLAAPLPLEILAVTIHSFILLCHAKPPPFKQPPSTPADRLSTWKQKYKRAAAACRSKYFTHHPPVVPGV
ncbi:hypothetical protein B0I35DRAFT_420355 [Stachybotrys elegans]|uniref:Uncharacterized protein n=1 Tax=Stachybotrys elegans TaxID=80388 RepID=A0A8K0WXA7_9HYPO|nr:hypothetical protein B0I35DRAFT_420355 [Stachybotrys elegans]